ncbi:MAG: peptide ABC transporter substrate-binding protein [Proteobacteria bacterium]|nr:peptide ABC transporter substrate-binding protein [Pseudomonadota bacterium]MBI3498307.1 peptide ABC transporter substrate-binding protein [Pseudomonadota bacterium]
MASDFPERDWRVLRELHPIALDRLCRRILDEIGSIGADTSRSNHERYLAIFRLIKDRDDEIADAFNDMRRSRAVMRLCVIQRLDLLTEAEFARFTEGTQRTVRSVLGIDRG